MVGCGKCNHYEAIETRPKKPCTKCGNKGKLVMGKCENCRPKVVYRPCSRCQKQTIGKTCSKCRTEVANERRQARKTKNEKLLARTCKQCGKAMGSKDPRQVVCSIECRDKAIQVPKVTVPCKTCGKLVTKYKSLVDQYGGACCSRECQIQWAMHINKGGASGKGSWRYVKFPILHFCECGELSKKPQCNDCKKWITRLRSIGKQSLDRFPKPSWMNIFNGMAAFHSKRVSVVSEYREQQGATKWSVALKAAERRSLTSMSWREKLSNMAGNQRQRMQRKSQAKSSTVC